MSIGLLQNIYGYGGNRKMNVIVFTRAKPRVSAVFAVERWLDGWMSITRQYCV